MKHPRYRIPLYEKIDDPVYKYVLLEPIYYFSPRYKKEIHVPAGYRSDGASGAFDISSMSWWVHDCICDSGRWDDDEPITNWQASHVLSDILKAEDRWVRSKYWFWATWLFGCKKARKNGMI